MRLTSLVAMMTALASAAHAGFIASPPPATAVPEIDALAGLAALAAVGGVLAIAIERKGRR